jgi:iron(III) transport system substrate-binding protein
VTRRQFLAIASGAVAAVVAGCGQTAQPKPSTSVAASPASSAASAMGDPRASVAPRLATLDQELALPQSVIDAARKEGKLSWISSVDDGPARVVMDAFRKRYPGIDLQYQQATEEVRTIRTLTEFKAGRNRIDVVQGIGGFLTEYRNANALTLLNDLPAYANFDVPYRDSQDMYGSFRMQFWAIGYNTEKVKEAELPRTWEELATPKWKGRFGLADRPQLWVLHLWKTWGADKATDFLKKVFANDPQRRKEGLDSSAKLLGAGEFDLFIPAAPYRIQGLVEQKTPVSWYTPEPLPVSFSDMEILAKAPNPNAAKVFANWFMSREGQAIYSKADFAAPTHPALRHDKDYLGMFSSIFESKPWAAQTPDDEPTYMPAIRKVWQPLWIGG